MNLLQTLITPTNFTLVLQELLDSTPNLDKSSEVLKLDLRNMVARLELFKHNDDQYHNGETVRQHIQWVLEDAEKFLPGMNQERRFVLMLTALLHDLGKAYTHNVLPTGKNTFYGHTQVSVQIAEMLLAGHREQLGPLYQRVVDIVRLHDVFMTLISARTPNSTKYVRRFMQEAIYQNGHVEDLLTLAKADSARSKVQPETLQQVAEVLIDIAREVQQAEVAEEAKVREQQAIQEKMPEIRTLLEQKAPYALEGLPDLSMVNRLLGSQKDFGLIREIQKIYRVR